MCAFYCVAQSYLRALNRTRIYNTFLYNNGISQKVPGAYKFVSNLLQCIFMNGCPFYLTCVATSEFEIKI